MIILIKKTISYNKSENLFYIDQNPRMKNRGRGLLDHGPLFTKSEITSVLIFSPCPPTLFSSATPLRATGVNAAIMRVIGKREQQKMCAKGIARMG